MRPLVFLAILSALACRPSGEDALSGRSFLSVVPVKEVAVTWSWGKEGEAVLDLRADHSCSASSAMVRRLVSCNDTYPAASPPPQPCVWAVEKKPEGEAIEVTFEEAGSSPLSVRFGAFRSTKGGAVALLGTCGSGDAYALRTAVTSTRPAP
jgi:hypothetical protein